MRTLTLLLVTALFATSCEPSSPSQPATAQTSPAANPKLVDLAHDLALITTGSVATADDLAALGKAGYSSAAFTKLIDDLLHRPQLGGIAQQVLRIGASTRSLFPVATLKTVEADGATIYYLHEPCTRKEAVSVRPWWDLSKQVLVCPTSYRPTVFKSSDVSYCSGTIGSPKIADSPCGCGPNLLRCVRDGNDLGMIGEAMMNETTDTISYIVDHDLPLDTLFSSRESFRSGVAELWYQKWLVEDGWAKGLEDLPDWRTWPKEGKWAPRPQARAEEHAGILTNLGYPQIWDSQRMRLYTYFQLLWCAEGDSRRVETAAVLDVGKHTGQNLRGLVKENELAAREGCGDCHARIDYGAQFFAGDQWSHKVDHYLARAQLDTPGPMYMQNLQDPRGSNRRNPVGFVELALKQPEYPRCMSKRVLAHVFGDEALALSSLDASLQEIVKQRGNFRALLRPALEEYKNRELTRRLAPPARVDVAHASLTELADARCSDCHDGDKTAPGRMIAGGAQWCAAGGDACRRDAIRMMASVAYGEMPKGDPLPDDERAKMVEALAPIAYPDPAARKHAIDFFVADRAERNTHSTRAVLARIKALTGAKAVSVPGVSTTNRFGVNLGAYATVGAIKACKGAPDEAACVRKALENPDLVEK